MNLAGIIRSDPKVRAWIERERARNAEQLEKSRLAMEGFAQAAARLTTRLESDLHPENAWRRHGGTRWRHAHHR